MNDSTLFYLNHKDTEDGVWGDNRYYSCTDYQALTNWLWDSGIGVGRLERISIIEITKEKANAIKAAKDALSDAQEKFNQAKGV